MTRSRRAVLLTAAIAAVLLVLAIVGLRGSRGGFTPPSLLKPMMAQVENGHVYFFAARDGDSVVLFDAGQDTQGAGIDAALQLLGAKRDHVHDIFLTHGHGDHLAGAPLFAQARVWGGAGDLDLASGQASPEAWLARLASLVMGGPSVKISQVLTTDEQVSLSPSRKVRAMPLPGHTPGSYAYLYDDVLFVGDSLSVDNGHLASPVALFDARPDANRAAVVALQALLADVVIDRVCCGHGGCTPAGSGSKELETFAKTLTHG